MFTRLLKIAISQPVAGGGRCKFTGLALRGIFSNILIKMFNNVDLELAQIKCTWNWFGIIQIGKYPNKNGKK